MARHIPVAYSALRTVVPSLNYTPLTKLILSKKLNYELVRN